MKESSMYRYEYDAEERIKKLQKKINQILDKEIDIAERLEDD